MDDGSEHKKPKRTKKCVIKRRLVFENYKDCLFNNKTILKKQQRFKSYNHEMYTVMMIRDYKHFIGSQHFHTEHLLLKCVKVKC